MDRLVTCAHCNGEINVPSGANLRCGCGRTILQGAISNPQISRIETMLQLAVKYKALRITQDGLGVEMSPGAFSPQEWPAQASTASPEAQSCRCGHSLATEHNEHGLCLHGCEVEACAPASGAQ